MRRRFACLLLAPLLLAARMALAQVVLHPPARDFGYFLGDTFAIEAEVAPPAGAVLDARSLPAPGPVSTWIDVRGASVRERDGRLWVRIAYQSFFDPAEAARASVPPYTLVFTRAGERLTVPVPGWSFLVSPFRHTLTPVMEASALRGDHAPLHAPERGAWLRLLLACAGALGAAGWLAHARGWWRLPGLRRPPFAAAARRIAALARAGGAPTDALLALHRAFDATAGRRVLAGDLRGFLDSHPRFAAQRQAIAAFFEASRRHFFGARGEAGWSVAEALALARALSAAERQA
jgi:mxaA protein